MGTLGDGLAALLPRAEGNPAAMMRLAALMRKDGQSEQALALCRRALALAPDDPALAARGRDFLSKDVPGWHFAIVADAVRNAAYDAALRRAEGTHQRGGPGEACCGARSTPAPPPCSASWRRASFARGRALMATPATLALQLTKPRPTCR